MKKHRLLFLWLSLLLCAVGARADEVQIGEGTATNSYLPTYAYYNYSLTQQIYTADEIGASGDIHSIAFNSSKAITRSLDIYLLATDKESFGSATDWEATSGAKKVFSGTVDFEAGDWTTIIFDTPYQYDGKSNLIVMVDDNTGSWESAPNFLCFNAAASAIRVYNDGTNYDPTDPSIYTGTVMDVKNQIILNIGDEPTCPKPTGLTVSDITNEGATLTWDAVEGTSYNLNILSESGEQDITGITSPYTITGLEAGTDYTVKVQAACSASDVSAWSSSKSFTTQLCAAEYQCEISYTLADSYGDGWGGNAISFVDKETGLEVANITIASGDSAEGTIALCNGRVYEILWVYGGSYSYPSECSFVITDVNGDEILNVAKGSAPTSNTTLLEYTMDCTVNPCMTPKDLTAGTPTPTSVELSWTADENQDAWEVVYSTDEGFNPDESETVESAKSNPFILEGLTPETTYYAYVRATCGEESFSKWSNMVTFTTDDACPMPKNVTVSDITANSANVSWEGNADNYEVRYAEETGSWLQYDDDTYATSIGSSSSNTWTWGVMYPGSMVTVDKLSKMAIAENHYNSNPITVKIYSGGDNAPGTLLYTEEVTPANTGVYSGVNIHEVTLAQAVPIHQGENLWITLTETGTFVLHACESSESNNDWVFDGESWDHIGNLASSLAGNGWMIRGYLLETDTWTTGSCTDNSFALDGLDPETDYVFQVRAKCDEESASKWANACFTTEKADAAPEIEITEVAATTATVDWTDKGADPVSWDLWYRLAGVTFENGELPNGWTTIDADNDGYNWEVENARSHSGSYCVISASYDNPTETALHPDNWLVSPEVTLGGSMTFWARGQDPNYASEHFAVYVSQGGIDLSEFTQVYPKSGEEITTGEYVQHTVDLSAYSGKGYVAIRHFNCSDMFLLNIDDILILEPDQKNDWVEMNELTSHPVTLEGLDPETDYEVQVRTHFASGDVSEWVNDYFITETLVTLFDDGDNNSEIIGDNDGATATVVLSGRTLFRDTKWNTICLPFNLTLEGSVLEGAIVKPLDNVTVTGNHITLAFGEPVTEIASGVPYIIKWEEAGEDIVNPAFVGVTIADGKPESQDFCDGNLSFVGYYDAWEINPDDNPDIWYLKADNTLTHTGKARTLKAFRTYFVISEDLARSNSFSIDFGDGETSTGITEIADSSAPDGYFNLQGVKFDKAPKQKGVYIVNGKKVVVK